MGGLEPITIIGACAAVASTVSFVPQAWKIIKSRRTHDISTTMYTVTVIGFGLWTVYGILLAQWPLIVTNAVCLILSAFILTMKILPRRQRDTIADAMDPGVPAKPRT
jgi:MtN3 and saliva related transmembrane protein